MLQSSAFRDLGEADVTLTGTQLTDKYGHQVGGVELDNFGMLESIDSSWANTNDDVLTNAGIYNYAGPPISYTCDANGCSP